MERAAKELKLYIFLLLSLLAILIWFFIDCFDLLTWFMEAFPVIAGAAVWISIYHKFRFTTLSLVLIWLHAIVLLVGAHYTYARVLLFDWIRDFFELSRNHYDRLGHFAQGFVPAILAREILLRKSPLRKGGWLFFILICFCLALSAAYELLEWLVQVVQEAVELPLAIDSANPAALEAGLKVNTNGKPIINSITAEERFAVTQKLIESLCGEGVAPDKIFLDPLIQPISVQNDFGVIALEVIRCVKQQFPEVKTACGLSNVSFGLPQRADLNRYFLTMAMAAGLDCAIVDAMDCDLIGAVKASEALLGKDRFCKNYIKAFRESRRR